MASSVHFFLLRFFFSGSACNVVFRCLDDCPNQALGLYSSAGFGAPSQMPACGRQCMRERGQCARSEEKGTAQPSSKITQGIRWCDFWELELNGNYHLICFHMQGKHSYAICSLMLHNMRFTRQLCICFCCSAGSQ